ncbi:toxin co-regulated pilus biosynthesis Q family protein [Pseudoalteromonas sp.]|uniref:toxin co-regulated pilus biosynthesis Q family protein n=1 Tax=Pseudoalteromonas sp. TaxID=53249 RepID=UPI001BD1985A|nr:toxin co-regulated pilus biosynthesis Q family protein [Pseudoalteromonas sp.]
MWFWIRYLLLALLLIGAAIYFLLNSASSLNYKQTTNAAAEGFSRFYASIRNRINTDKNNNKFVIQLDKPDLSLDRALNQRSFVVKPMPLNWSGKTGPRRFQRDETLRTVLTQYADNEGVKLLWYLDKDYVVKDHFRIDGSFNSALYRVSRSINDDFENEVYAFFCPKQRAAVITELPSEFVRSNCLKISN